MKIAITGGTSGIGLAITNYLTQRDHQVFNFSSSNGFDLRDEKALEQIIYQINHTNFEFLFLNSGITSQLPIGQEKNSKIDDILNINLTANLKIINGIWPKILNNKIKVVVTLSTASYINGYYEAIYNVSKKGLKAYVISANTELKLAQSLNQIFTFVPHYVLGTKMTSGKNFANVKIKNMIEQLFKALNQNQTCLIPQYEQVYKKVFDAYYHNPIQQGLDSFVYRQKRQSEKENE